MKLIVKCFLLLIVIGIGGLLVLKRPDGQPWLTVQSLAPDLSGLESKLRQGLQRLKQTTAGLARDTGKDVGKTQVYKWQAADGSWTYSDKPPPDQKLKVKVMTLDSNTNVIPALKLPTEAQKNSAAAASSEPHALPLPLTASPGEIGKLKGDAENLQQVLDQRAESLESL